MDARDPHLVLLFGRLVGMLVRIALIALLAVSANTAADQKASRIHAKLENHLGSAEFDGITAGWVAADGKAGTVSAGFSDRASGIAMRPELRMPAGSIGKTFVAAYILTLVEQGKLDLDSPIGRWIGVDPWFARLPNAKALTLRLLLTHQSGMPDHLRMPRFLDDVKKTPERFWPTPDLIAYVLDEKPLFEAGKGWAYADMNFIIAGYVAEKVTGKPLMAEIQRTVVQKAKLKHTSPSDRLDATGFAVGHSRGFVAQPGLSVRDGRFTLNPQMEHGGGGMGSTAEDLARWAKSLYEGKVIPASRVKEMIDASVETRTPFRYGLGVQIRQLGGKTTWGHGGIFPGYLSEMYYFPDSKLAVAVQVNTDDPGKLHGRLSEFAREVAAEFIELPVTSTAPAGPGTKTEPAPQRR
jgi:D-alanyl-D-alanine carboxypeptidase